MASNEPQAAAAAPGQPNDPEKQRTLSDDEFRALFKAASERAAAMSPEEIQKQHSWIDAPNGATTNQAMEALEEAEAPDEEDSDDAGDIPEKGPGKPSTKPKEP